MCYNKKGSEKGALSGHVIQLSIKTLASKFGKWINPIDPDNKMQQSEK
jgi:hypothetical protein